MASGVAEELRSSEPNSVDVKQVIASRNKLAVLASVRLTVTILALIASTVLIGAWCPQEAQAGKDKVIEQFGEKTALILMRLGITDIFHTPWFLSLIGLLTVNMVACSVQRVFPKVKLLRQKMPWLSDKEIVRLPVTAKVTVYDPNQACLDLEKRLRKLGYRVSKNGSKITAEFGKVGRLAPTVTHIGLLTLLVGVTITSWTGFSGFKAIPVGSVLSFADSEHSKLWVGALPKWRVRVDATRRENYEDGDAKQWYSDLSVIDTRSKVFKKQQISVNNPLSYNGVDIYQSSWGLDQLVVSFNGHSRELALRPMGKLYASFLPLAEGTILIMSVRDQDKPLRLFAKTSDWQAPRLIAEVGPGLTVKLGEVSFQYVKVIPVTGLQYKCDPGLPLTFVAFGFIISGVLLATIPHRHVWASISEQENGHSSFHLYAGGRSVKAKTGFERQFNKIIESIRKEQIQPYQRIIGAESEVAINNINDLSTPLVSSQAGVVYKSPTQLE